MIPNKPTVASETLACFSAFKRRILRLSSWTVHNANHLCPSLGWLKGAAANEPCAPQSRLSISTCSGRETELP